MPLGGINSCLVKVCFDVPPGRVERTGKKWYHSLRLFHHVFSIDMCRYLASSATNWVHYAVTYAFHTNSCRLTAHCNKSCDLASAGLTMWQMWKMRRASGLRGASGSREIFFSPSVVLIIILVNGIKMYDVPMRELQIIASTT